MLYKKIISNKFNAFWTTTLFLYDMWYSAECHSAKCRSTEGRGAVVFDTSTQVYLFGVILGAYHTEWSTLSSKQIFHKGWLVFQRPNALAYLRQSIHYVLLRWPLIPNENVNVCVCVRVCVCVWERERERKRAYLALWLTFDELESWIPKTADRPRNTSWREAYNSPPSIN